MREYQLFIDWRPVSTAAFQPSVSVVKIEGDRRTRLNEILADAKIDVELALKVMPSLAYAIRSDGVFAFYIEFDSTDAGVLSIDDRTELCCIVASFIKNEDRHFHYFDRKSQFFDSVSERSPLFKYPVQVTQSVGSASEALKFLEEIGSDPKALLETRARPSTKARQMEEDQKLYAALFVLRSRYASRLDRTFEWVASLRGRTFLGFRVFHRSFYVLALYVTIIAGYTVHNIASPRPYSMSEIAWMLISGALSGIAVVAISKYSAPYLKAFWDRCAPKLWLKKHMRPGAYASMSRNFTKIVHRLSPKDWQLFVVVSGPFVFSIAEMPDLNGFLKLMGVFDGTAIQGYIDSAASSASVSSALSDFQVFFFKFLSSLLFFGFMPLLYLHSFEKDYRNRVVEVLDGLVGHLRYANTLDGIIVNIMQTTGAPVPAFHGYHSAIAIAERRLNAEVMKRTKNEMIFTLGWVLYVWYATITIFG